VHSREMIELAKQCAREVGLGELVEGPYGYFTMPAYETPAEVQMMKQLGVATVGGSTIPEQMAFYSLGNDCLAFSAVACPAAGIVEGFQLDGEEIIQASEKAIDGLRRTISKIVEKVQLKPKTL